jgi:phosphatidylserine/phosphatidylglycerophosphate/cardiolipin synthase-like enzyme
LLVQPGAGVAPLLSAIRSAKKNIELMIFRFDEREIELALEKAVTRGVSVHALIAYTNSGDERSLRNLESRLLSAGVTVGRTAHDLARYHTKLMIVDRRVIYLMTFNYTHLDIYDGKLTDPQIIRLLQARASAGVEVRVIGHFNKQGSGIQAVKCHLYIARQPIARRGRRRVSVAQETAFIRRLSGATAGWPRRMASCAQKSRARGRHGGQRTTHRGGKPQSATAHRQFAGRTGTARRHV